MNGQALMGADKDDDGGFEVAVMVYKREEHRPPDLGFLEGLVVWQGSRKETSPVVLRRANNAGKFITSVLVMKSTDRCHATTFSAESAFNGGVCSGSGQNRVPSVIRSPVFILDGGWTALVGDWLSWAVPLANRLYHS
ncbi:hypothetical protein Hanom_Chr03g00249821 [Helianthus anomalus]